MGDEIMDVGTGTIYDFVFLEERAFSAVLYPEASLVFPESLPTRTHLMSSSGLYPHQPMARWLASCLLAIAGDEKMPPYCQVTRMETEDADGNGTLDGFVSIDPTKLPPY